MTQKRIEKTVLFSLIGFVLAGFILLATGITSDRTYIEHGLRHTLGFGHPNDVSVAILSICALFWLYNFDDTKHPFFVHMLFDFGVLLVCFLCFLYTKSRTALIASLLLVVFSLLNQLLGNRFFSVVNYPLKQLITLIPFIMALLFIGLGLFFIKVNYHSNFAYRFYEGIFAIKQCGISLWGTSTEGFVLDNMFYSLLINYGLISILCYLFLSAICFYVAIQKKSFCYLSFMLIIQFYTAMESHASVYPLLFVQFSLLFSKDTRRI